MSPADGSAGAPEHDPRTDAREPTVAVEDVDVSYGDVSVLAGVSLSVAGGEFVGLVGPNGAGKTTLLKTINGILAPDAGTVRVDGDAVHDLSSRAASRRVATVPQESTIAFDFSVEDVVEMGRTPYHGRFSRDGTAREAVERALDRTDTAQFRDRSVQSLSGGERQRVLLARALAQETPALLLDEPTDSLDINHQVRTLELVRDLADDGVAVLAAIHDLDLAARFCDRIAVLTDGDVLAVGPPAEVLQRDHLAAAFDTDAAVLPNPVTGTPAVTPVDAADSRDLTCHVLGTGEATARAIASLHRAGFDVTAGPLPAGDVAAHAASELADSAITTPPFAGVDADAEAAAADRLSAADATVLVGDVAPELRSLVGDGPVVHVEGADAGADVEATIADDVADGYGDDAADGKAARSADGKQGAAADEDTTAADEDVTAADEDATAADRSLVETVRRAVAWPGETDD